MQGSANLKMIARKYSLGLMSTLHSSPRHVVAKTSIDTADVSFNGTETARNQESESQTLII